MKRKEELTDEDLKVLSGEIKKLCKCGCGRAIVPKKYHERLGIPKYVAGHSVIVSNIKKTGKTYEEIYGKEDGEQRKQNLMKPKSVPSNKKGKNYDELYGAEKASKIKDKLVVGHLGQKPWNKGLTKETNGSLARMSERQKGKKRHKLSKTKHQKNIEMHGHVA